MKEEKTMKKPVLNLVIAVTALGLMSGCGASSSTSTDTSTGTETGTVSSGSDIHIASWNNAADNLSEIAEAFNKTSKNGKVIIDYADGDYTKLKPSLQAGTDVPDIFQTQNRDIQAFYNTYGLDKFADISDIIEPDAANWAPAALGNCKASDGKYYSIPWDIGPCGLYYRTDIFEEAGIDVSALTTWDNYLEAGIALKAKGDYYIENYSMIGSGGWDNIILYLNQLGGQYYDADGKVNLASDEMVKAFEMSLKFKNAGVVIDIPAGWDDRIKAINDNKLVAFPYAAWYMGTMQNSCADLSGKWAIAPLPSFEEGVAHEATLGGSVLAISSQTKNLELAKEFLVFAMKDNTGNDINMKYGEFPSYSPAYTTEFFKSPNEYFGGQATGSFFAEHTAAPATDFGPYFTDIYDSMVVATGNILSGGMEVKEALEAATKDAQTKIDIK